MSHFLVVKNGTTILHIISSSVNARADAVMAYGMVIGTLLIVEIVTLH